MDEEWARKLRVEDRVEDVQVVRFAKCELLAIKENWFERRESRGVMSNGFFLREEEEEEKKKKKKK